MVLIFQKRVSGSSLQTYWSRELIVETVNLLEGTINTTKEPVKPRHRVLPRATSTVVVCACCTNAVTTATATTDAADTTTNTAASDGACANASGVSGWCRSSDHVAVRPTKTLTR